MSKPEVYPLYGSTFTLFRASPLYHGSEQLYDSLDQYARRLREDLAGDRARSVLLTELQPEIAGTGRLESCDWNLLSNEAAWDRAQDEEVEEPSILPEDAIGIQINLRFERAKYAAYLLGDQAKRSTTPGFTSLPLILIRMPVAVRELFFDFLSKSFDTRLSPMRLRSSFLSSSLEDLLRQATPQGDVDPAFDIESLTKGVGLQLSFPSVAPHLKNIDMTIKGDDIRGFLKRGTQLWQERRSNQQSKSTWSIRPDSNITGPFTAAVSAYISNHIAMELDNPAIVMSKVAIGPFALGGEGKVKILTSSPASMAFWDTLILEAHGPGMEGVDKSAATTMAIHSRTQRLTSVPTEPPPPYELHDSARRLS